MCAGHTFRSLRRLLRLAGFSLLFLLASHDLSATTVQSLDLDALVKQSWAIAQVTVGNLQSFWTGTPGSGPIATRVTFVIQKVYKGPISGSVDTDFLGGTIGTKRVSVPGIPQFQPGQRLIVFLANPGEKRVSGTIGLDQGVLRILSDPPTGADRVYRSWGQGVSSETNFKERSGSADNPETLSEFESQLSQAIAQASQE